MNVLCCVYIYEVPTIRYIITSYDVVDTLQRLFVIICHLDFILRRLSFKRINNLGRSNKRMSCVLHTFIANALIYFITYTLIPRFLALGLKSRPTLFYGRLSQALNIFSWKLFQKLFNHNVQFTVSLNPVKQFPPKNI